MPDKDQKQYEDRERLDDELRRAIDDIVSAEAEARGILEKAEASVKAIQLDAVAQERTMRETNAQRAAAAKEAKLEDAAERAEKKCEELIAAAKAQGDGYMLDKKQAIEKRAKELFDSLGGK